MKFGQLIEYEKRKTFLHKSCKKCGRETKSRPLFIFKTALYEGKASCLQYRTLDCWFRNKLDFDLLEMGLGIVLQHILKMSHVSCYLLWTDQISLSDCFYLLWYWAICVFQLFISEIVKLWILKLTLSFLSSRFSTWPKSQENEKSLDYVES